MKKQFPLNIRYSLILVLWIMVFFLPTSTKAQIISYNIYINDEEVTSDNYNDLSVIRGVEGNVRYQYYDNTLVLENATITALDNNAINIFINRDHVKIKLIGKNTLKSKTHALVIAKSASISGSSTSDTLYTESVGMPCTPVRNGSTFLISNCTLAAGGNYAIVGYSGREELYIANANIIAGGYNCRISGFFTFKLTDCKIVEPQGAYWNKA